jgi:molybdopterin-containing oxidoreductase family membrane subunit
MTITAASFGWFTMLFLIFCKVFPSVSMYEVKEMVYHRNKHGKRKLQDMEKIKDDMIKAEEGLS